jgi:hypothetical protein
MSLIGWFTSCMMGTRPLGCRWVSGVRGQSGRGGCWIRMTGDVCGLLRWWGRWGWGYWGWYCY